ncbi:MAG: DNA damage-inducible protein D [Bacilli bacterium]|nr:DNA damage-inducible protein D [Bacilli bacterium]
MTNIEKYTERIFEDIKHIDEYGCEYWEARELMPLLEYSKWDNFHKVIKKAMIACEASGNVIEDCFPEVRKSIISGKGRESFILDYHLSRYACYLIMQNADSNKKAVSLGQTYLAIQTRKQEITEQEYANLSEDEKRLYRRKQTRDGNKVLYKIAREKGVKNFDKFTNAGYKGLYNGETADDIAKRKGLRYREDILDNMSSVELGANIFRITQTEALLEKQKEKSEELATDTHYRVGKAVRDTIKELGGTMPEDLSTPKKSIKQIKKENQMIIK